MRVHAVGDNAVLAELADPGAVAQLYADLRRDLACRDLVPGARTVLLDGPDDLLAATRYLADWRPVGRPDAAGGPLVEVPTTYDGADLGDVARRWGVTRREAVGTLATTEFVVAFCGFLPGFAYCRGLPDHLAVPRLDRPRARVPAGSVGLADAFAGVYPAASPGGWRLVGTTGVTLWATDADPPALLAPGTRVRFPEA